MGPPAWQASSTSGHNALLPDHCLLVDARRTPLTSPALSTNSYLHSPTLQKTLATTPCSPFSPTPGASTIMPSEPGPIRQPPAMTPPADHPDVAAEMGFNNDMNVIVGGALQPIPDQQNPQRLVAKAGPGLRLPSFEAMGIASPRPDYFPPVADGAVAGAARDRALSFGSRSHSHPGRVEIAPFQTPDIGDAPELDRIQSPRACLQPPQNPVHQYVATLTPPAETGDPSWRPSIMTAAMGSPNIESQAASLPSQSEPSNQSISAASDAMQNVTISEPATSGERAWLEGAVQALREFYAASKSVNNRLTFRAVLNLRTSPIPNPLLKVLSHALPSPSHTGHAYTSIIEAIHDSTPTSPTMWINLFHAIPGRFNLEELPTSPPNTPGPPIGGDDYFTQKIFGSAVPITDYQQDLSSLPRSPRPVVPPNSIDVSIVERYIPPSSPREFKGMFSVDGPSILIDRLIELSPHNGSLVFIYPTKVGAQTFMQEYLSPILDPVLRSTVTANGLSSELCQSLGSMPAVNFLPGHAELERKTIALCAHLTQRSATMSRFHGHRAKFSVVHSSTKEVPLSRQAWAKDWWTKQEKTRVAEVVVRNAQEAQTKSSNRYVDRPPSATELWQKLLKDVENRPYDVGTEPKRGVEVAMFVIKRSE
jgi:hypothetical protein